MMKINGTKTADVLIGTDEDDVIIGGRGDDILTTGLGILNILRGGRGRDELYADPRDGDFFGKDVLLGGRGADNFHVFAGDDGFSYAQIYAGKRDTIVIHTEYDVSIHHKTISADGHAIAVVNGSNFDVVVA